MSADSTRRTVHGAVLVSCIREMVSCTHSALADAIEKLSIDDPLEEQSSDEVFGVAFVITRGIYSAVSAVRLVSLICRQEEGEDWKQRLGVVLEAMDKVYSENPFELMEEQRTHLAELMVILDDLNAIMDCRALNSDLGSGDFFSDEELRGFLGGPFS